MAAVMPNTLLERVNSTVSPKAASYKRLERGSAEDREVLLSHEQREGGGMMSV